LNIRRASDETRERLEKTDAVDFQILIRQEVQQLLERLSAFAFDCGLDTLELIELLRVASIKTAAKRQMEPDERISISRVSALTGISRTQISGVLKSNKRSQITARESVLNRILRGWRSDSRFLTGHRPKALKLFGRNPSFEFLVKLYGRGLPVRAVFDELICVGAIELLPCQIVVLLKPFAVHERISHKETEALLKKVRDLLGSGARGQRVLEAKTNSPQRRRNLRRIR
jgi:hypothetical protein